MKQVAVINDISGFGNCSLGAALPVLSVLGVQCNPIPIMSLTGQGGYPVAYRKDLSDMLSRYTEVWSANDVTIDGIYCGHVTEPQQIAHITDFLSTFRKEDTFLLVDPAMGDNGHTYESFSVELLDGMKRLTRQADLIIPNLTEACLLADVSPEDVLINLDPTKRLERAIEIAGMLRSRAERPQDVVITGIIGKSEKGNIVSNVGFTKEGIRISSRPWFEKRYSGTGDLFSSAMCGLRMNGNTTSQAMDITVRFLHLSIADGAANNAEINNGVPFQRHLNELLPYAK